MNKPPPPGHTIVDGIAWSNANPLVRGLHLADAKLIDRLRLAKGNAQAEVQVGAESGWNAADFYQANDLIDASYPLSDAQREQANELIDLQSKSPRPGVSARQDEREVSRGDAETRRGAMSSGDFDVAEFPCAKLMPHPDNREITKAAIEAMMESFQADGGQLEPLVIRPLRDRPDEMFEILSGETRWSAAINLGWRTIKARVIECDDARAQELLSDFNAHRKDLTPIEQARRILRLCDAKEKGGAGLTRDQAAKKIGLQDGASASNLVRLLDLPKKWQDRVSSGELPQSYARELLPLLVVPQALDDLEREWKLWISGERMFEENAFSSRAVLAENAESALLDHVQRLDERWQPSTSEVRKEYGYNGAPIAFDVEAHREQLQIVTITVHAGYDSKNKRKLQQVEAATNLALFEKLQVAAMKAQAKGKADKARSSDAGIVKKSEKKALTPAEKKARAKEQAEQLQRRIDAWRHAWLAKLVAAKVAAEPGAVLLVVLRLVRSPLTWRDKSALDKALDAAAGKLPLAKRGHCGIAELGGVKEPDLRTLCGTIAEQVLGTPDHDPRMPRLDGEDLSALAVRCKIDLASEWRILQKRQAPELDAFYSLHSQDQLATLADELGVSLGGCSGKEAKILRFLEYEREGLPASIKPLVKEAPAKKAKR